MNRVISKKLNDGYFHYQTSSGMDVYLLPKEGIYHTTAYLGVKFGSLVKEYDVIEKNNLKHIILPTGIAHFLEHIVFSSNEEEIKDVSKIFVELGADVNAYTTYDRTVFTFSTTKNVEKCLNTLLSFVLNAQFSVASIEKEKGIIEQELLMYIDRPDNFIQQKFLEKVFEKNPIRNDVGGSLEDVKNMNINDLKIAYEDFYNPRNMCLAIVGNMNVENVINIINNNKFLNKIMKNIVITDFKEEHLYNDLINKRYEIKYDVYKPKVLIGLRLDTDSDPIICLKKELYLDIICSMYFGASSKNYYRMLNDKIIDYSYTYDVSYDKNYGYIFFQSDVNDINLFVNEIKNIFIEIKNKEIEEEKFKHYIRRLHAANIRRFNNIDNVCEQIVEFKMNNMEYAVMIDIIYDLRLDELKELLKLFDENKLITICLNNKY